MHLIEVNSFLPQPLPPLPFLPNWNFIVSDILLEKNQAEAVGGKSFGYKELLSIIGSNLCYIVPEHTLAFNTFSKVIDHPWLDLV